MSYKLRRLVTVWIMLTLPMIMTACGQKGALYLPEEISSTQTLAASTEADDVITKEVLTHDSTTKPASN